MDEFKVFCDGNSSCSFMLISLNHYRCLGLCLKMCISIGYNPHIIFVTFLQVEISHLTTK